MKYFQNLIRVWIIQSKFRNNKYINDTIHKAFEFKYLNSTRRKKPFGVAPAASQRARARSRGLAAGAARPQDLSRDAGPPPPGQGAPGFEEGQAAGGFDAGADPTAAAERPSAADARAAATVATAATAIVMTASMLTTTPAAAAAEGRTWRCFLPPSMIFKQFEPFSLVSLFSLGWGGTCCDTSGGVGDTCAVFSTATVTPPWPQPPSGPPDVHPRPRMNAQSSSKYSTGSSRLAQVSSLTEHCLVFAALLSTQPD